MAPKPPNDSRNEDDLLDGRFSARAAATIPPASLKLNERSLWCGRTDRGSPGNDSARLEQGCGGLGNREAWERELKPLVSLVRVSTPCCRPPSEVVARVLSLPVLQLCVDLTDATAPTGSRPRRRAEKSSASLRLEFNAPAVMFGGR